MNGYESAFKGAMHAYGILANKAVRMVKHVTGLAGDSVEHYWPTECEQCKEIAAFLDEWQERAAELPLEPSAQHTCPSCDGCGKVLNFINQITDCTRCNGTGQV